VYKVSFDGRVFAAKVSVTIKHIYTTVLNDSLFHTQHTVEPRQLRFAVLLSNCVRYLSAVHRSTTTGSTTCLAFYYVILSSTIRP
jgi:hypothetical protein